MGYTTKVAGQRSISHKTSEHYHVIYETYTLNGLDSYVTVHSKIKHNAAPLQFLLTSLD